MASQQKSAKKPPPLVYGQKQFIRLIIVFIISSLGPFFLNSLMVGNAFLKLNFNCITRTCCRNSLILQPTPGNIGNQLFQYATLLAHAKGRRRKPLYVKGWIHNMEIYKMFVNLSIEEATCDTDESPIKHIGSPTCCSYNKGLEDMAKPWPNYKISGYFQSWKHFDFARPILLKEFVLKPEIENKALDFINKTVEESGFETVINVGIHVRRTDFVSLQHHGFCPSNDTFIKRAIEYVKLRLMPGNTPIFYVVGDDLPWMKSKIQNLTENTVIVDQPIRSPFIDFALLKNMDIIILSAGASTYGWFAAYLNTKAKFVVYNYQRANINSSLYNQTVLADYFYPKWTPLM